MYLHSKLKDYKKNINIAFIGCGKFISMFLSQYNQLKKINIDAIVDLDIEKAKSNCIKSGLAKEIIDNINFVNSIDSILDRNIEIVIEATGNPIVGTQHAYKVIQSKKHIIMVNVEADVLCGKYLSDLAKKNNVIYSMAYGDQPSLILEQIEWARLNGFFVTCAAKVQNNIQVLRIQRQEMVGINTQKNFLKKWTQWKVLDYQAKEDIKID